jgi:3-deoxy-D-manno-octulosonic-acid transferase
LWRARREPLYGTAIGERFGLYRGQATAGALWIHAVSLGETRAVAPLIDAMRAARPGVRLLLTHGTATGRAAGRGLLREGDHQVWLPVDTPGAVRRFFRHFRPAAGVLMETEIWPNLLAIAAECDVPVLLANARMSERSRRRGQRVDVLLRPAFESLAEAWAQSDADAARLRAAGVRDVSVVGNLKFDLGIDPHLLALGKRWKVRLARAVVLAAVTREGEEALLLAVWRGLPVPRPLLVVVPRHPQRFEAVAALIEAAGFTLSRRSAWRKGSDARPPDPDEAPDRYAASDTSDPADTPPADAADAEVWLGDSLQEMPAYYALADVALLGGSFEPLGGQNLIEAAACACPLVMGPHTFNFAEAAALSLAAGASVRAPTMEAGVAAAVAMLASDELASRARAALGFAAAHRGAAARVADRLARLMTDRQGR